MRSHRRRLPVDHVLIAGHVDDLDAIRAELTLLSADAYGQVFVEAPTHEPLFLITPPRVTIHRIDPQFGSLADAIAGWVDEWIPEQPDPQRSVSFWISARASADIDAGHHGLDGSERL